MHIDLQCMLPNRALSDIEKLVVLNGSRCPNMLWPLWAKDVNKKTTSINILQAGAQLLSSFGCVTATLRFGLYCSKHFSGHGHVLSDDAALHYLRIGFTSIAHQQRELLKWLQNEEGFEYEKNQKHLFWINACAAYANHEFEVNPEYVDSTIEFAFRFLLNGD